MKKIALLLQRLEDERQRVARDHRSISPWMGSAEMTLEHRPHTHYYSYEVPAVCKQRVLPCLASKVNGPCLLAVGPMRDTKYFAHMRHFMTTVPRTAHSAPDVFRAIRESGEQLRAM